MLSMTLLQMVSALSEHIFYGVRRFFCMNHSPFFSFNFVHLQDASVGPNFGFLRTLLLLYIVETFIESAESFCMNY